MSLFDYFPSIATIPGFILYSIFAYIITFTLSTCSAYFVSKNIDVEGAIKKQIIKDRTQRDQTISAASAVYREVNRTMQEEG